MSRGPIEYHLTIHEMPLSERPRERLMAAGASALSNAELLAIILRTGTARESALALAVRLLREFNGLPGLSAAAFAELHEVNGMGEAKACEVLACLELGRRLAAAWPADRPQVRGPGDVAALLLSEMSAETQEQIRVVLLNRKNMVVATPVVYRGNVSSSVVRMAEVFHEAIRQNCPSLILVHNHPSGDPTPSPDDVGVTAEAVKAGRLLDIEVLDHLIIAGQKYVSLKEQRLGFV